MKTGTVTNNGTTYRVFSVETEPERDPWGDPYRLIYTVDTSTGKIATVYFASAGADAQWQNESDTKGYIAGITSDDIVMSLVIRETVR